MLDALVVGAGPAGAVAATVLARAGARVRIVDRARFPRDKLCGDTLNPGALRLLRTLDLSREVERESLRLDGMVVTGPAGARIEGRYPPGVRGCAITRRRLDQWLVEAAVRAGAEFHDAVSVREARVGDERARTTVRGVVVQGDDGRRMDLAARITVAADGRRSTLAFALGLAWHPARPRRWAVGAYFENVDGVSSLGEMHVRRGFYVGIAPLPGGLVNVCLVTGSRPGFDRPDRLLESVILAESGLRSRFARARRVTAAAVVGPLAVEARSAGAPGLLLAGDAAGFIDPMTGDGLRFAIRGGELAARAALSALAGRCADPHDVLARWRAVEFSRKRRFNRLLRGMLDAPAALTLAETAARVAPSLVRRAVVLAGDAA